MKKSDKKSDKLAEVHKALLKMQFLNTYYYSKVFTEVIGLGTVVEK